MPKSLQAKFNDELANMLKEASAQGQVRKRIKAKELHDRAIEPGTRNAVMPTACISMFRLALHQRGKAKLIGKLPNGATSTLEIEFDTADLPD